MMTEGDSLAPVFEGEFAESVVAKATGGHFEGFTGFASRLWHIDGYLFIRNTERFSAQPYEGGVLQAGIAPDSVLHMGDDKTIRGLSDSNERLKQGDGIGPAGDGDQQFLSTQKFTKPGAPIRLGMR